MEMVWDWKSIGSLLATLIFIRSAINDYVPTELRQFLDSLLARIFTSLRPTNTIIIEEIDVSNSTTNELWAAAQSYLSSCCLSSSPVIRLSKARNSPHLTSSLPASHTVSDTFHSIPLRWSFKSEPSSSRHHSSAEHRFFELSFHRCHRDTINNLYIPFLIDEASRLSFKSRERRLYTNRSDSYNDHHGHQLWSSVSFAHPSTFDTLAIDPALRDEIRSDLMKFTTRRDYYARVGRVWKRGFLLHGPPGTGKTSLIAAIANFLKFDVYDLELTSVTSNSHLRKLLISTTSKSVIVVEDVDCSLDLSDRKKHKKVNMPDPNLSDEDSPAAPLATVSLSGVLNFVDGLWSSCVGERLMVFTTNHPERLDPALLRPGRMDRQIHLSYCGPPAFRTLVKNYLEVGEERHVLMEEAEKLLEEVKMTPAEVAEIFMGCDGDATDVGMQKAVEEMRRRKTAGTGEEEVGKGE